MKIIEKRNYIILFIIIILIIFLIFQNINKKQEYSKSYNYFNHYIVVKIYENKNVFDYIDKIYKKYDKLDNTSLKKINNYGKKLYTETNGYIDINNQIEKYNDIVSAYATNEVVKYLKKNNIDKYLISDDGDITAGKHYDNEKYNVSIINPKTNKVLDIVELENESLVTRESEKYDTLVVAADNVNEATMLADMIRLMDLEEGKKLIKKYKAKALWYKDEKIEKENF